MVAWSAECVQRLRVSALSINLLTTNKSSKLISETKGRNEESHVQVVILHQYAFRVSVCVCVLWKVCRHYLMSGLQIGKLRLIERMQHNCLAKKGRKQCTNPVTVLNLSSVIWGNSQLRQCICICDQ